MTLTRENALDRRRVRDRHAALAYRAWSMSVQLEIDGHYAEAVLALVRSLDHFAHAERSHL